MVLEGREILPGQTGHEAGRRLLTQMYLKHTGTPMPRILLTARGKPCFEEGGVHFSITHTPRHVFCVLAEHPVGIDAEELSRQLKPGLADKILSPAERVQYEGAADKNRALLTFWVLKEAAAKCSGEGLRGYPVHTDFSLNDPRVQEIEGCLVAVLEDK